MLPVLTPQEMAAVDAAAPEPVEVLITRAGGAVARAAVRMLGGTYGRRVVVVAGRGNNGNDGRDAARRLARRGVRTIVIPAAEAPARLPAADLVIDAAYGTGFRGEYAAPDAGGAPVLSVDIPSGVDGLTGAVAGTAVVADRTVSFAALKPGHLFQPGRALAGEVELVDIGLDTSGATVGVVERADVAAWVPPRLVDAHKWRAALAVVGGSRGMTGAVHLVASAAQRAGAGMVRVSVPGVDDPPLPIEAVGMSAPAAGWEVAVLGQLDRFNALVVGPGLGPGAPAAAGVSRLVSECPVPLVVDGDGLGALSGQALDRISRRSAACVLTPHDGEFARLAGRPPGPDRIAAARQLAAATDAVVLLKGATTVVAAPDGRVRVSLVGDQRLATAGTGDVLSGVIGALLARGADAFDAAAAGAWLHGRAALAGPAHGLVASDLLAGLPVALAEVAA